VESRTHSKKRGVFRKSIRVGLIYLNNMKTFKIKQIWSLLIIFSTFLASCNQNDKQEENIEEDIMANIKQDGWLFESEMGCDQLSDFSSEWDVKGIYISKDSLIEIYIRESYEYKNEPRHSEKVNFQDLKNLYSERFEQISNRIKINGYTKFGLLFYEGRYNCEDGVNIQKNTIPIMFTEDFENKEYVELGLIPGP
jgi:hypothetical protein